MTGGSVKKKRHKWHSSWEELEWLKFLSRSHRHARTHAHVTVLAECASNTRGDQHSIKHSSRGTVHPETSRSFLLLCILVAAAGSQQQPTRGGKSKKGGDSWLTSCTIILKHHRERTREAAAAAAGARTNGYTAHLTSFSAVKRHKKRGKKKHFTVDYTPG